MLQKKSRKNSKVFSSNREQPQIINKKVPPYRNIRLFPRLKIIMTDFDFFGFINDLYGHALNRKLSNTNFLDFEDLVIRGEEKGWQFYDVNYTHSLSNWQVDNRLLVFCRGLINGHEYTICQWEGIFIFIKDSEAFESIQKEGTSDPSMFLKSMQ